MKEQLKTVMLSAAGRGLVAGVLSLPGLLGAGDIEPSAPPGPTMKTLDEIPPTWSQKLDGPERFEPVLWMSGMPGYYAAALDKETGLVWELYPYGDMMNWDNACVYCYNVETGMRKGWRLPTIEELASLVDPRQQSPALPLGHPFSTVQTSLYWSSTTGTDYTGFAWHVYLYDGTVARSDKSGNRFVWCVRGGQGHDGW